MTLIVRCLQCRRKLNKEEKARKATSCPACGSADFRHIIDYYPSGRAGGRKQISLPDSATREEAEKHEEMHRLVRKKKAVPSVQGTTVADLFPNYLLWYKIHRAETSFKDCSYAWRRFEPILGAYQVRDIATEHFSLYQLQRKPTEKNRAANKELAYFKGFLRYCRREKKIDVQKIEYEPLRYDRPLPIVLSLQEIDKIMKEAKDEPLWHAFLTCLYYLGFRLDGVRNLKPSNFDFRGRTVGIQQKGGSFKIQPLNKEVIAAVRKLIKIRSCGPDDHLFVTRFSKGKPVQNVREAVARICERAGIKKRVYPHLFRHSVATQMINQGIGIRTVQDFLGHKNMKNTEIYTHISIENLRAAQASVSTNRRIKSA